ncbi:hypothetical protein JCM16303_002128 [Sporobolomyces ruberrimus]
MDHGYFQASPNQHPYTGLPLPPPHPPRSRSPPRLARPLDPSVAPVPHQALAHPVDPALAQEQGRTASNNFKSNPTRPPLAAKTSGSKAKRQTSEGTQDGEGSSVGGADAGEGSNKAKRTRNRKPASCAQCRKKKLRCNRADPCDQCTAKGYEELCSWEGAEPLYTRRNETDTQELREQVARLESLVRYLSSQKNKEEEAAENPASGSNGPSSPNLVSFPSSTTRPGFSGPSNPTKHVPKPTYAMDLRANDLCEGLAQLAIKEFVVVEGSGNESWAPGHHRGLEWIDEARLFLRTMPQQFGVADGPSFSWSASSFGSRSRQASNPVHPGQPSPRSPSDSSFSSASHSSLVSPSSLGTSSFGSKPPTLNDVLKYLPTRERAHSSYRYFADYVSWYAHPVHQSAFEEKWRRLEAALQLPDEEARHRAIDPFFIATFLGIIATGLSMMPVPRAMRDGFPEDKDRIVDQWLEGSMLALTCGGFLDNPSVEAVSATVILSTFFVFTATGERAGAGMGLLSLVVQIALSLGLHRDPDQTPGRFTFFEAEERRRLFWNLFMLCILSSSSLSRTWAVFDLNNVDTKLPLDCHDHEILDEATARAGIEKRKTKFAETPMTSLIVKMKLAVLAKKMNDRAFGITPVPYEDILALDAEIHEFEASIPARYRLRLDPSGALLRPTTHVTVTEMRACMIMISLAGEYIRLHRPWLLLSEKNKAFQFSRDQAIKYSKILLAVYRSPSCSKSKWGGLTYKATNAAIVLAIDILAFPDQAEVDSLRSTVKAVQKQMDRQANYSSLCRKGSRLIGFLVDKDATISSAREERQRRQQKRAKVGFDTESSFDGLRNVFDTTIYGEPVFMHERDEEEEDDETAEPRRKGRALDDLSALTPASSVAPTSRPIANFPSHPPPFRPAQHPLEYLAPPVPAGPDDLAGTIDFAGLAGSFDFDFTLPTDPQPHLPSPALTSGYYYSQASAHGIPGTTVSSAYYPHPSAPAPPYPNARPSAPPMPTLQAHGQLRDLGPSGDPYRR